MTTTVAKEQYRLAHETGRSQYTPGQILAIWLAAGAPMWVLGWLVYPALSPELTVVDAGLLRIKLLIVGLVWQCMLSMLIVYLEAGDIRPATIRRWFRLNHPVSPKTGQTDRRLWWLLIPLVLLGILLQIVIGPALNERWTSFLPFLAEPEGYSMAALFTPGLQSRWIGAWDLLALYAVLALFNAFLGEELLFRGTLLPRMAGVFGKWDWVANAIAFGLYHLHQPWGIPGSILSGLLYAFSGRQYRSTWFPVILHSGQSIYFLFLILGIVLGLA